MKLFRKDKKGVSPVIGVILMVAITVILAAVIASFVFGMGSKVKSAPQAQFMLEDAPQTVNSSGSSILFYATLYGGEDLKCNDLKLQIINTSSGNSYLLTWNSSIDCFVYNWNSTSGKYEMYAYGDALKDGMINVGDMIKVNQTTPLISSGTTLEFRVIHIPTGTVIYDGRVLVN